MIEKELEVKNKLGFHARPAALFVKEAAKYKSAVSVFKDGVEINGKSVLGLLMMAAESGSHLKIRADGPDEKEALAGISRLFAEKFQED